MTAPDSTLSTATDRDALAYAAFDRLTNFERRVLGVAYGLLSLGSPDGKPAAPKLAAVTLNTNEPRINRNHESAIGKLSAVLDLEPNKVVYWLFRMATLEMIASQKVQATPEQPPAETPLD